MYNFYNEESSKRLVKVNANLSGRLVCIRHDEVLQQVMLSVGQIRYEFCSLAPCNPFLSFFITTFKLRPFFQVRLS